VDFFGQACCKAPAAHVLSTQSDEWHWVSAVGDMERYADAYWSDECRPCAWPRSAPVRREVRDLDAPV